MTLKFGDKLLNYSVFILFSLSLGISEPTRAQTDISCTLNIDFLRSALEFSPAKIIENTDAENSSQIKLVFPVSRSNHKIDMTVSYYACYHIGIKFAAESIPYDDLQIILPWIAERVRLLDKSSASYIDRLGSDFGKVIKSGEVRTTGYFTLLWDVVELEDAESVYNFTLTIDGAL